MPKRGQLTVFIILGIVLLLVTVASVLFSRSLNKLESSDKLSENSFESQKVKTYVESCLKQTAEESIINLADHGGTFDANSNIYLKGLEINILAEYESGFGYNNKMLVLDKIESELAENIKNNLKSCIDWGLFRKEGYNIKESSIKPEVIINPEKIEVFLDYPIELTKNGISLKLEKFSTNTELPFFKVYSAAIDIVNQEAAYGYFDKEQYMLEQTPNLIIEKYKPYPDVIYSLKEIDTISNDELIFNFAIKGKETYNKELLSCKQKGCCVDTKGIYFRNVDQSQCVFPDNYSNKESCSSKNNRIPTVDGCCFNLNSCQLTTEQDCKSKGGEFSKDDILCAKYTCHNLRCRNLYDTGQSNLLSNSMIQGQSWCSYDSMAGKGLDYVGTRHYLHSCINGVEYIEPCRDYREELCTQDTITVDGNKLYPEARCRINRWYDCSQQTNQADCMDTSKRDCYWSQYLNIEKKCYPYVPPGFQFWENDNNICNVANFEKNDYGQANPNNWGHTTLAYCQRTGDCGNYRNVADDIGTGGYYNPDGTPEPWIYWNSGYTKRGNEFTINLGINNTFTSASSIPSGSSSGYARCDLWQPPNIDKCELCVYSKERPCTEYKCRSLGKSCIFDKATNKCGKTSSADSIPPIIHLSKVQNGFDFTEQPSFSYEDTTEYTITPNLLVHNPFNFQFTTTEPTRCKLSLVPPGINSPSANFITDIFLNAYDFLDEYNITIRLPSSNLTKVNHYQLFIRCNDQSGNINEKEVFMDVYTSEISNDLNPPEIIDIVPETSIVQGGVTNLNIFTNEPFESCRYSNESINFNSMTSLNCPGTSESNILYNINYPLGSYLCSSIVNIPSGSTELFFACKDKKGNTNSNFIYQI